ncbi:hypothetical protein CSKR_203703 [Clonorchis sinensis]|uniref:Uncharacterized protein n=1 Tax=Clonorchis sinensis TaxID=79923 RepID=A0A8T1N064_CLOSI|nr:hypothetical protein CSKR_203703 [Clonorchis sinensis]
MCAVILIPKAPIFQQNVMVLSSHLRKQISHEGNPQSVWVGFLEPVFRFVCLIRFQTLSDSFFLTATTPFESIICQSDCMLRSTGRVHRGFIDSFSTDHVSVSSCSRGFFGILAK